MAAVELTAEAREAINNAHRVAHETQQSATAAIDTGSKIVEGIKTMPKAENITEADSAIAAIIRNACNG